MEHYNEEFEVYLYKNNLWLKGKKNFFGEDYSKNFIRFTYAEDFTFNIFETEIRGVTLDNLPKITFSVNLNQIDPTRKILNSNNTFINTKENACHTTKIITSYPEFIIHNTKTFINVNNVEMPMEIYKKKHLENEFELIMINCRLYVISKYLKSKIYFGHHKLKYELWAEDDKPVCSLELCPKLNQTLDLDVKHEDSDDDKDDDYDNDYKVIRYEIQCLDTCITNLSRNVSELSSKLDYLDGTIRSATFIIVLMLLLVAVLFNK